MPRNPFTLTQEESDLTTTLEPDLTHTTVVSQALEKLAAQGSRSQIADYLIELDMRGRPGHVMSCPVARYLIETTGIAFMYTRSEPVRVECVGGVASGRVTGFFPVHDAAGVPTSGVVSVVPPDSVKEFIDAFDTGRYPKLERWT